MCKQSVWYYRYGAGKETHEICGHAQSKLLRVALICKLALRARSLSPTLTKENAPNYGAFFLVQQVGKSLHLIRDEIVRCRQTLEEPH